MSYQHRFICFSTIGGEALSCAATASKARQNALDRLFLTAFPNYASLGDDLFLEVLDCGADGEREWELGLRGAVFLHQLRQHPTAFRGAGYAPHLPAVALEDAA